MSQDRAVLRREGGVGALLRGCAAIVFAAAVFAGFLGCDNRPGAQSPFQLRPDDPAVLAQGQRIYTAHCAACHGAKLEGQPNWRMRDAAGRLPAPPHDASGHTWHHPDEALFKITKYGVAKAANLKDYETSMPIYENVLTDAEIVAVLSWIKAQWPAGIRRKHDEVNKPTPAQ